MSKFLRLASAGPLFFVSAWLLMLFVGGESGPLGVHPVGYVTAMVLTIGLWLVLTPAISAVAAGRRRS